MCLQCGVLVGGSLQMLSCAASQARLSSRRAVRSDWTVRHVHTRSCVAEAQ